MKLKKEKDLQMHLLSIFKATLFPRSEVSHFLLKETSIWSSFWVITLNSAASTLQIIRVHNFSLENID